MASRKLLVQLDIKTVTSLQNPEAGYLTLSAKTDGLYQKKPGGTDEKLAVDSHTHARVDDTFIAVDGQATFATSLPYAAGSVDVYFNGSKLNKSEFTANDTLNVVLNTGVKANDVIEIISGGTNAATTLSEALAIAYSIVF